MHLVYTSGATVLIIIVNVIFYTGIITILVHTLFPFGNGQSLIFPFSLVATAMISESVLLQKRKQSDKDFPRSCAIPVQDKRCAWQTSKISYPPGDNLHTRRHWTFQCYERRIGITVKMPPPCTAASQISPFKRFAIHTHQSTARSPLAALSFASNLPFNRKLQKH